MHLKKNKLIKYQLFVFLFISSFLFSEIIIAQEICGEVALNEARKNYETGNFNKVILLLKPCIEKEFNEKQKIQAYRILSETYIALDSLSSAYDAAFSLIKINPNFEPNLFDPPKFIKMINEIKEMGAVQQVTSVSKKPENLLEAPATIIVITREEIDRRGYIDIVQLLKDIPGFDISMFFGPEYANIYQRGFRQNNTEKTLILIDGIEDNDLWTNWAYISRQYSITNIERVEVIYGPASTMYGPNAFAGVINIITKGPKDIIKDDKNFGISAQAGYGSYNSKYLDLTLAAGKNNISFSLTGRIFYSDEMDISSQPVFDFDASAYDTVNYFNHLNINQNAKKYIEDNNLPWSSPYYIINADTSKIALTPEGAELARNLDKSGYDMVVDGEHVGFSNKTKAWYLNGKFNIGDFSLGFQTWKKSEGGLTQFTDAYATGITAWVPFLSYIYAKYEKQINDKIDFSSLISYRIHQVDESTRLVAVSNYARDNWGIKDLVEKREPVWNQIYLYEMSKQLRTEIKVLYQPSTRFDIITGIELRNSQLQGNYLVAINDQYPQDSGVFSGPAEGGNQFNIFDLGFYSQATYSFLSNLKFTIGARLDYDKIRTNGGFGTEISPRVAIVYAPKKFIFKAIYSRGIQNVSNWTKFSTAGNRIPNPKLGTGTIQNLEVAGSWNINEFFFADIVLYNSRIKDVVGKRPYPEDPAYVQNANIGEFNIIGLQSNITYKSKTFSAYLNYTFTDPKQIVDETGEIDNRVGDIASHQINAGLNKLFFGKFNFNLRMNYIGERKTGPGTTVPLNDFTFPSVIIFNTTLGYQNILPGLTIQLICNNLFNKKYYDPGVKLADGYTNPSQFLQRDRNFMIRILYDIN